MTANQWVLIVLWSGWCAVHSLLITVGVQRWFRKRGGLLSGLYRLVYVCFSLLTLLILLWWTALLPQQPINAAAGWLIPLQGLLFMYSLVMFVGGLRAFDLDFFLGLRQWRAYRDGKPNSTEPPFCTNGILGFVRHPWYSGGIAFLWSLPGITDITMIVRTILSIYLVIGTLLEERKLRQSLGAPYTEYCQRVPMLIPWTWPPPFKRK